MSGNYVLELTLRDILHVINPTREDWSVRFHIIDELRAVVQSVESLRGATVEPFGSFVSNIFSRWGDLDISIELPNGSYISSAGRKRKQNLLEEVQRALRMKGGCRRLRFIAHARVPILKFESHQLNISCDISINNLNGQMKSKMLFWINEIDRRFRDMVLLVKEWAKAHGINGSTSGTLNSYTLSLLVVFHFQTCEPALLPPLKEIYPGNLVDDLIGVRAVAERSIEETCAANIHRFKTDRSRRVNRSSLPQLFISFIEKFSDIDLKALEQGICLHTGEWEDINRNTRWLPRTFTLFVEDPFEQPVNTARNVSITQMKKISKAFQTTHQMLISTSNQNQSSLIAILVRPQVSYLFGRTPVMSPSEYARGYLGARMEASRPVKSPSQKQFQKASVDRQASRPVKSPSQKAFQKAIVDRHPNNVTKQRPTQILQSQPQQKWRPRADTSAVPDDKS